MAIIDQIEYSVCEDCLLLIANGEESENCDGFHVEACMKRELNGRKGHWVAGVQPTDDDEEGTGYEEFSGCNCELCNTHLAGSRHGVSLLLEGDDDGQ